jgi:uncharacterized membrane protein YhiD involved in acid resistance
VVAAAAVLWLSRVSPASPPTAAVVAAVAAVAVHAALWLGLPASRLRRVAHTVAMVAALVAGAILREQLRIDLLEEARPRVAAAGGLPLFVGFFIVNTAAVGWCIALARRHLR